MEQLAFYKTKYGYVKIGYEDQFITKINLLKDKPDKANNAPSEASEKAIKQLKQYFEGRRTKFNLKLKPQGTEFQMKVWKALKNIPYGETKTYKDIAKTIGNPNASRAVGMANHNNPLWIVIPCHRVVGTNGKLTGYAGGIDVKEKLLTLEAAKTDYYTYMVRCADGSIYTGITTDLDRRLKEHKSKNDKSAKYTKSHTAVVFEAAWKSSNKSIASTLEYNIKQLTKTQKERLIADNQLEELLGEKVIVEEYERCENV